MERERTPADCRGCEWLAILELLPGSQALRLKCWALLPELFAAEVLGAVARALCASGFDPRQERQYQHRYR